VGEEVLDLLEHDLGRSILFQHVVVGKVLSTGTQTSFSSPPVRLRGSARRSGARTTQPGTNGERAITSASSGSPSGERVCGTKP
jgi:hypothetical protein